MKPLALLLLAMAFSLPAGLAAARQSSSGPLIDHPPAEVSAGRSAPVVLEGRVVSDGAVPAAGAVVVSSAGGQAVTESDGRFRLSINLPDNAQSVQVTAVANGNASDKVATTRVSDLSAGVTAHVDLLILQQSSGCRPNWLPTFGSGAGLTGAARAFAVFDDGSGSGPALYVAGLSGSDLD
jgi:hypothetical protein